MKFYGLFSILPLVIATTKIIAGTEYQVIEHEDHPDHKIHLVHNGVGLDSAPSLKKQKVSIKDVCAGATPGYTGYLISGSKHFYFAYFQSRSNPAKDPLVMWINGGPGCSSSIGLLHENGPCNLNLDGEGTTVNKYAWINTANMFYLDQPLGVGFSYDANKDSTVLNSTAVAAEDLTIFLKLWYHRFPHTRKKDFHMSGESYAGHYLPKFADHILQYNEKLVQNSKQKNVDVIPLKSIMVGNGMFDIGIQDPSIYNVTCTNINRVGPILDLHTCKGMETDASTCQLASAACFRGVGTPEGNAVCDTWFSYCQRFLVGVYQSTKHSIYDITKTCKEGVSCDPIDDATLKYMNLPKVRAGFGASDLAVSKWDMCNDNMLISFYNNYDPFYPSAPFLSKLLDKGLRIFLYAGVHDVICNFVGVEAVLSKLSWSGIDGYRTAAKAPRKWSGGLTWESGNLRYARVDNAGHYVPNSQPVAALELFTKWIRNEEL